MNVRTLLSSAVSLLTASALSACADPPLLYGDQPRASTTTQMPPTPMPDLAMEAYPEGPYGSALGDTLFDIDLSGYRMSKDQTDSSALTLEEHLTLSSVRQAAPNAKCIWIQIDAFW